MGDNGNHARSDARPAADRGSFLFSMIFMYRDLKTKVKISIIRNGY
jgi:hypothetical protein